MLVLPHCPHLWDALWQAEEVQRRRVSARGEKQSARPRIARELGRKGRAGLALHSSAPCVSNPAPPGLTGILFASRMRPRGWGKSAASAPGRTGGLGTEPLPRLAWGRAPTSEAQEGVVVQDEPGDGENSHQGQGRHRAHDSNDVCWLCRERRHGRPPRQWDTGGCSRCKSQRCLSSDFPSLQAQHHAGCEAQALSAPLPPKHTGKEQGSSCAPP